MVKVDTSIIFTLGLLVVVASMVVSRWIPPPQPSVLGIDFGTSFSSAAYFVNGKGNVEIIPDYITGHYAIPSMVAITENGTILIGDEALAQATINPNRTMYHLKRFLGRDFFDRDVQRNKHLYSFPIRNQSGKPYIYVNTSKGETIYSP